MPKTSVCPLRMRVVVCFSAWLVLAVAAPAQIRNRILQNIGDTEPVVVSAPHPLARAEFDQGRVEGSLLIDHAAMVFKLAPTQQAALDKLLAEQQDPHSPNFRKWLTPGAVCRALWHERQRPGQSHGLAQIAGLAR